jgi:hypothetical protein
MPASQRFDPTRARPPGLADALRRLSDVTLEDDCRGSLKAGGAIARLRIDPAGWLRIELPLDGAWRAAAAPAPRSLLEAHRELPGNLRFAAAAGGALSLAADLRRDGLAHLEGSVRELAEAIERALARAPAVPAGAAEPGASTALERAIAGLEIDPEDLVARSDGWEIRCRTPAGPVSCRLASDARGARVWHVVLKRLPDGGAAAAVAAEALGFNARLRMARLAIDGASLVAETRLRAEVLDAGWLGAGLRAVAACGSRCRAPLRVLAENAAVARCYAAMFLADPASAASTE